MPNQSPSFAQLLIPIFPSLSHCYFCTVEREETLCNLSLVLWGKNVFVYFIIIAKNNLDFQSSPEFQICVTYPQCTFHVNVQ